MAEPKGARVCNGCGGSNVYVKDTRYDSYGKYVRRRLECLDCGERWTTYEVTKEDFENVKKASRIIAHVKDILSQYKERRE